jgi:hypothetical protein
MRRKIFISAALVAAAIALTACSARNEEAASKPPSANPPVAVDKTTDETANPADPPGEVYENGAFGIGIVFPPEYAGKYTILQSDANSYAVAHTATRQFFMEKNPTNDSRGLLFVIERRPLSDEEAINNLNELATPLCQTDEYAYFLRRPTDVEFDEDKENPATKEYRTLYTDALLDKIAASAYPLPNGQTDATTD